MRAAHCSYVYGYTQVDLTMNDLLATIALATVPLLLTIIYKVVRIAGWNEKILVAMLASLACCFISYACLCMFNNAIY